MLKPIYLFITFLGSKTYLKLDILLENIYVPFEFYVYEQLQLLMNTLNTFWVSSIMIS